MNVFIYRHKYQNLLKITNLLNQSNGKCFHASLIRLRLKNLLVIIISKFILVFQWAKVIICRYSHFHYKKVVFDTRCDNVVLRTRVLSTSLRPSRKTYIWCVNQNTFATSIEKLFCNSVRIN